MPTCDHTVEVNVPTQFVTVIGQWKNFKFLNKSKQWCSTNHIILFGFNWKILDFLYGGKFKEFHELIHIICDAWFLSLVRDEFLSKGYFQKHDIKLKVLCSLQYLPPSSPCQSIPESTVHKVFFFCSKFEYECIYISWGFWKFQSILLYLRFKMVSILRSFVMIWAIRMLNA